MEDSGDNGGQWRQWRTVETMEESGDNGRDKGIIEGTKDNSKGDNGRVNIQPVTVPPP